MIRMVTVYNAAIVSKMDKFLIKKLWRNDKDFAGHTEQRAILRHQ